MSWEGSDRRSRLPPDWPRIRARALSRDGHRCTWFDGDARCVEEATDVDHVVPGDDHGEWNLQSLCSTHHKVKTAREASAASVAARAARPRRRPTPPHPGLIDPGGGLP